MTYFTFKLIFKYQWILYNDDSLLYQMHICIHTLKIHVLSRPESYWHSIADKVCTKYIDFVYGEWHTSGQLSGQLLWETGQKKIMCFTLCVNNVVNFHPALFKHCSVVCYRGSFLHVEPLHRNNITPAVPLCCLDSRSVFDVWLRRTATWTVSLAQKPGQSSG